MRPMWRLATSSLCGRGRRTALLVAAVALATALIVADACALASINHAIRAQLESTVGTADIMVRPGGKGRHIDASILEAVRAWPEVESASPRLEAALSVRVTREVYEHAGQGRFRLAARAFSATAMGNAISEQNAHAIRLVAGRLPEAPDEIAIDLELVRRLAPADSIGDEPDPAFVFSEPEERGQVQSVTPDEAKRHNEQQAVRVGDTITAIEGENVAAAVARLMGRQRALQVVGIAAQPPMGGRAQAYMTLEGLRELTRSRSGLSRIDVRLRPGFDPESVARARAGSLGPDVVVLTTARVTSGLERNMRSSELGFVLALVLSTMAAGFIIVTGLNTSVAERARELGIMRCIGASRTQVGVSQLLIGVIIGSAGAIVGVPLGIGIAVLVAWLFRADLPTGLVIAPSGPWLGAASALGAGLLGAAWPAWQASRMSPLRALGSRAAIPRSKGIAIVTAIGALGLLLQGIIVGAPRDGQVVFWGYATAGLPLMFTGYFLLGVPMALLVARLASPAISRVLRLPAGLLRAEVSSTPYRYGLTAGALMAGLALMVTIWTNGGSILRDWLDKLDFPDAFVTGIALTEASQRTLDNLPFVENTCTITLHPVETDAFGVRALQRYRTTFIAFEPDRFFDMARIEWVQGSPDAAIPRLKQGDAIIVSREFLSAKGLGVGDTFSCSDGDVTHDFEIVGVVTSPGLEIVSKFYNIGQEFHQQALHAVFGSRDDLRRIFKSDAVHLIQIDLADDVDDDEAIGEIRRALWGAGVLDAGSGRQIKEEIRAFALGLLLVFSVVAVVAMLVACFGVANIVIAGIEARQFEFGVLRAVGAHRGTLARLVIGEALIVALSASILGTLMGTQASWASQKLYRLLLGLDLHVRPPPIPIAAGWLVLILLTLAAATPAIVRLNRKRPRDLLAATRG